MPAVETHAVQPDSKQEETPVPLLRAIQSDVPIKGENYRPGEVFGAQIVESYGGRVFLAEVKESHRKRRNSAIRRAGG